jgi:hypothetical protein
MTQVVLTDLAMNCGFYMSPDFRQLQLRNCLKSGDCVRQSKPGHLVAAMQA